MELTRLRPIYEEAGPYVTLHVETGRDTEDAESRMDARWTTIRHDLERFGLDSALIEEIGDRVRANTHRPGAVRRTLVANDDKILFDDVQTGESSRPEVIDRAELPELSAWLAQEDQAVPFVLVVADREGADIEVHRALARPAEDSRTVTGETFYITKVAEGDWAHKQFQQTAENTWKHNAGLVADAVRSLAREHRPALVLVAGEVRARAEVTAALEDGEELGEVVQVESGGRAAGSSDEALWDEVRAHLARAAAAADADVAARLDEARGRGEGAATGIQEVLTALAKAQVEHLVVDLDEVRKHTVDPGAHDGLALPKSAVAAEELPADRVLVAAAALSGARLSVLPAAMSRGGGVSALLRWDDSTAQP